MDKEINRAYGRKVIWTVVAGVIVTALVVGTGVYLWQDSKIQSEKNKSAQEIRKLKKEIDEIQFPHPQIEEKDGKFYIEPVEGYSILGLVFDVHTHYDGQRFGYSVVETGGGDPALNGDIIYVAIIDHVQHNRGGVWKTNINVANIDKIDWQPQGFILDANEDYLDETGSPKSKSVQYKVDYLENENKLVVKKTELGSATRSDRKIKQLVLLGTVLN